ncbi:MAG: low temperature requirement protein A [Cellulomonas sp.]|jgi:low temperature requirement protein LtrA|nr:low temperature requirement protein A [Cellulomonas sp.]
MRWGLRTSLLRPGRDAGHATVSNVELFYDLVFVFAVTQLSQLLVHDLGPRALVQTFILAASLWTLWIDTAWVTNWLDPRRTPVAAGLLVTAGLSLVLSAAISEAFDGRAWYYAVPVVTIQVGRSVLTAWAMARHWPENALSFVRIGLWHCASGTLWLLGAAAGPDVRLWVWLAAVAVELAGPRAMFWVPRLGGTSARTWDVHPEHMSERVSLFVIIVLGESIVVTGASFAETEHLDGVAWSSLAAAFVSTVACYLLFFRRTHDRGAEYFAAQEHPGMVAQTAYTYVPLLLVLAVVGIAVGDELVLAHPAGEDGITPTWTAWLVCGATAMYLGGNTAFHRATGRGWSRPHLVATLALVALVPLGAYTTPLTLSWVVNGVMVVVLVADEWRDLAARRAAA